jgi:hypothetical protein
MKRGDLRPTGPGLPRSALGVSQPQSEHLSPASAPALHSTHLVLLRGAFARCLRRRDGCGACGPSRKTALGRHWSSPRATRSPCQELADGSVGAVERDGPDDSGARCRKRLHVARRKAPAASLDADAIGLRFSARHSPLSRGGPKARLEGRGPSIKLRTRDPRRGKENACLLRRSQGTPSLPLTGRGRSLRSSSAKRGSKN